MAEILGGGGYGEYLSSIGTKVKGPYVQVGFLHGATYPNGTPVAMVAAIQEFGASRAGIPPRPFFRTMIEREAANWSAGVAKLLQKNKFNAVLTLNQLGQVMAGQLQQSIADVMAPPLSPTTLMLRKMRRDDPSLKVGKRVVQEARARVAAGESALGVSDKPLVDTGHLMASVSYQVIS